MNNNNNTSKTYYKTEDNMFKTYCMKSGCIRTEKQPNYDKYNYFHLTKGYESTENGLIDYAEDIKRWSNEIKKHKILLPTNNKFNKKKRFTRFDYLSRFNHNGATISFLKIFTKNTTPFDSITIREYEWVESCNNGMFMYFDNNYTNKPINVWTYDYTFQYPILLGRSKLQIPTKSGTELTLDKLPRTLKFGFYKVEITGESKGFCFGKKNVYTHYDIKNARRLKLNIKLIINGKPNAYVYEKEDLLRCSMVFNKWLNFLLELKKLYPHNKLVKHLGSSIWGSLSAKNLITIPKNELQKHDLSNYNVDDIVYQSNNRIYYKFLCNDKPYKTNFRLKSFIQAYSRLKTSQLVMIKPDHVVRAYADSVTFKSKLNIKSVGIYPVKLEKKSTGKITFSNVKNYSKM